MPDILADPTVAAIGGALATGAVALWLAAAWWTYRDASRRSESSFAAFLAAGWIVLSTPLMLPLALVAYTFARPPVPASDHRTKALLRELAATTAAVAVCAGCRTQVDPAWRRCPDCATWLASPCAACGAWSDPSFEICPWCAGDTSTSPGIAAIEPTPPARTARRHGRLAWRAVGPGRSRVHRPSHRPLVRI
jgi:hypothetical protein